MTAPDAPSRWKVVVGTAAGVVLGGVLVVGLYGKALDPEGFVATVRKEGLDFLLPAGAVAAIGLFLEACLGFALLLGLRRLRILLPTAALVLFFVFLTGRAYVRSLAGTDVEPGCGCFGNLVERSPAEAFWQDVLMLVPSLALSFLARPKRTAPRTRTRFAVAGGLTAAVLVFAWFAPDLPLDDMATRLSPGVRVAETCAGEGEGRVCLDAVVPELAEGAHVVVLADLADPELVERLDAFNEHALAGTPPRLWVLTGAPEESVGTFAFERQPAFALIAAPRALLRPLYRRLPRSALVRDGTVVRTWSSWPPAGVLGPSAEPGSEETR